MSAESDQPEPDAVDEAKARAELPVRYTGTVGEDFVEVLARMADRGPVLFVRTLDERGPYDNRVPASQVAHDAGSALEALEWARELAGRYDLEEVEG